MDYNFKVSIITVTKNSEKTIQKTLQSIKNQSYENVEYIIIDGNSVDNTINIVKEYSEYISCIVSEPDEGIYDAMNKGISYASGDIVLFLGAGDYLLEKALKHVLKFFFDNPDIDIYCGEVYKRQGDDLQKRNNPFALNPDNLRYGMIYCHQAVFAKKVLFDYIGKFNTRYKISSDYDWLLRAYYQGAKFFYEKEYIAVFDYNGISSRKLMFMAKEALDVAKTNDAGQLYTKEIYHQYYQNYINAFVKEGREYNALCQKRIVNEIPENKDIYIFGAGDLGTNIIKLLQSLGVAIKGIFDNSQKKNGGEIYGITVMQPRAFKDAIYIIVTSQYYDQEICKQLDEMGYIQQKDYVSCDFIGKILEENTCL